MRVESASWRRKLRIEKQYGFTLIEILVTISLLALVTVIGLPNLRKFNIDQGSENSISDFVQVIRKAQSNSQSKIKCPDSRTSVSWSITIPSNTQYRLNVTCLNSDNTTTQVLVNTYPLLSGLTFDSSDNKTINSNVVFNNLDNTVCLLPQGVTVCDNYPLSLRLKKNGGNITVKINQGGVINVN